MGIVVVARETCIYMYLFMDTRHAPYGYGYGY